MSEQLKTLLSPDDTSQVRRHVAAQPCLTDGDILSFVQGALPLASVEAVHAHLDACDVCQKLVSEAAHALDAAPISESTRNSWNAVFQNNSVIAKRYRILRLVARGGMGEVYEAFDMFLRERVALKTVAATHCDSAQAVRLLKAEVQLARRISHSNVCRIFDLGTHLMEPSGDEVNFLVMEFVEGECLGKRLRHYGALEPETALELAHELLLGLAAAHQAGILHRDFKSENVMLRVDAHGRTCPVILDFGLAKVLNEKGTAATTQHQGQAMVGTIGYMAPEQVEGEPLSIASDVYAFGVVLFEMLTGRLPFEGKTAVASAVARLHQPPTPPSQFNPKVEKWLDAIVLRCLGRNREERFATAEEVLQALANRTFQLSPKRNGRSRTNRTWLATSLILTLGAVAASLAIQGRSTPVSDIRRAATPAPTASLIASDFVTTPSAHPTPELAATGADAESSGADRALLKAAPPSRMRTPTVPPAAQKTLRTAAKPKTEVAVSESVADSLKEPDWLPLKTEPRHLQRPTDTNNGAAVDDGD